MSSAISQIELTLTAKVQVRQKYDLNKLAALMGKSMNLPVYSEQTLWDRQDIITEFRLCSSSTEALDLVKRNKYSRGQIAACVVGPNFAEIGGFCLGDKSGRTEILVYNIPRREIMTFLESMKNIKILALHDREPFENGGLWERWQDRADNEERKS